MNPDNGEYYPDTQFILRRNKLFVYRVADLCGDGGRILIIGLNIQLPHLIARLLRRNGPHRIRPAQSGNYLRTGRTERP